MGRTREVAIDMCFNGEIEILQMGIIWVPSSSPQKALIGPIRLRCKS